MRGLFAFAVCLVVTTCGCDRGSKNAVADPPPILASDAGASPLASLLDASAPGTARLLQAKTAWAVTDVDGDGIDDVVALAQALMPLDETITLVAVSGKTNALLWSSRPVRPWGLLPTDSQVFVLAAGGNIALAAGWSEVQFFDARTGTRKSVAALSGIPGNARVNPANPGQVFVRLRLGTGRLDGDHEVGGALIDVAAAVATAAPPPSWASEEDVCDRYDGLRVDTSTCRKAAGAPAMTGKGEASFVQTNAGVTIAVGYGPRITFDSGASRDGYPEIVRFDPSTKSVQWRHRFHDDPYNEKDPRAGDFEDAHGLSIVALTADTLLVAQRIVAGSKEVGSRVFMVDPRTGAVRWRRTYWGRVVVAPRQVGTRIYLPRQAGYDPWDTSSNPNPDGQLDVVDAADGQALYTIGITSHGW